MKMNCQTEEAMLELGRSLGSVCEAGTAIGLSGDLGAGKTVFARGLARGLGIEGRVPSPTYVVVQTLEGGRLPLWHGDLYRLTEEEDLEQLGLLELFDAGGVVILEWGDRFASALPDDRLDVHIVGEEGRTVELLARGPHHAALLERLHG